MAFIDWPTAGPTDGTDEIAATTRLNAQLHDDDIAELLGQSVASTVCGMDASPPASARRRRGRLTASPALPSLSTPTGQRKAQAVSQTTGGTGKAALEMFAADEASRALGIDLVTVGAGTATARMRVTETMVNGHGLAHGGYLFLLADTTFACACNSHGPRTVASGAEISFVSSAYLNDDLVATAQERTRYGRNGIYDVTVYRETTGGREVVAEFRGRSRTIQRGSTTP